MAVPASEPRKKLKPRGKPFPKGAFHPRWKGGKGKRGTITRLPDGTPLWQVFRTYTEDAAHYLGRVMMDEKQPTDQRVKAASMILQRGWGDAPKALQVTAISDTTRANELTEADILSLFKSAPRDPIDVEPEAPPSRGDEGRSPDGSVTLNPPGMEAHSVSHPSPKQPCSPEASLMEIPVLFPPPLKVVDKG